MTKDLANFIKKRKYLIWYVKDVTKVSTGSVVEHVLNYGDWDDVQKLFKIIGIKKAARIFYKQTNRPRINYRPKIVNYFKLYFDKYVR